MRTAIFSLVLVLVWTTTSAQIERDKALHFIGGNLYGLAGAGIAKQISKGNRWWTFAGAIGGSTLIGLGKEAVDAGQRPDGWDNDDLLATILGGATVGITIDLFTNKKKQRKEHIGNTTDKVAVIIPEGKPIQTIPKFENPPALATLGLSKGVLVHY